MLTQRRSYPFNSKFNSYLLQMDRSNSLNSNFRSLTSHAPFERLTHRLTPKPIDTRDSRGLIRIPHKNSLPLTEVYSQLKNHQWIDIASPNNCDHSPNSPNTRLPNSPRPVVHETLEQLTNNSKVVKSHTSTSTARNWEGECREMKRTIETQRQRIGSLEVQVGRLQDRLKENSEGQGETDYRLKLEETEQRMGEENAYLRECMFKLHEQLESAKNNGSQKQIGHLKEQNRNLVEEIKFKSEQLEEGEENYNRLVDVLEEQKVQGRNGAAKLREAERQLAHLENEKGQLVKQFDKAVVDHQAVSKKLESEKDRSKALLAENSNLRRQLDSQKQMVSHLRSQISSLRSVEPHADSRSSFPSKHLSVPKLNLERCTSRESHQNQRRPLTKMRSARHVSPKYESLQFQLSQFMSRAEQLSSLKAAVRTPSQEVEELLEVAEYFNRTLDNLLDEKVRNQQLIDKYKRLVEVVVQSPEGDSKPSDFINDIIDKCSLLESSLQEKISTIHSLQGQLNSLRKETETKRLGRGYQEVTGGKRQERSSNRQTTHELPHRQTIDAESSMVMSKLRQYKATSAIQRENPHLKLKNISGEEILKQMEGKLKVYEGEIVPGLQAQIIEYKGIIDDYESSIHTHSRTLIDINYSTDQSMDLESHRTTRLQCHSLQKRKTNTSLERPINFKNLSLQKPGTGQGPLNPSRKRLDQIQRSKINKEGLTILLFKLCEVAQMMTRNSNFVTIVPQSVYIINYCEHNLRDSKLKVLETPKTKTQLIKNYLSPETSSGGACNELSLVWNIGLIVKEIIEGEGCFKKTQGERVDLADPLFSRLLQGMLEPSPQERLSLQSVQSSIVRDSKCVFQ